MPLIKKGGTYLITGGMGNVGFLLAKFLLQKYDAMIILTGRRNQKEIEEGQRYAQLESINGKVAYRSSEVSDEEGFTSVVGEIENTIGPINGVIHAAGILDLSYFQLIEDITPEKALAMMAPKVGGLVNIHKIFRDRKPDFVWVTSSISSVLGGLGFSAYAAS